MGERNKGRREKGSPSTSSGFSSSRKRIREKDLREIHKGVQRLYITIITGVVLFVVAGFVYAFSYQRSLKRDAARLDVIRQAEAAFQKIYYSTGSYQAAAKDGCSTVGAALSTCNFLSVSVDVSVLRDPGKSSMRMTRVPDQSGYEATFVLERRHGSLAKGPHTLTPQGIR